MKFHPLAAIFPLMEGEEFDALVSDIKANALRTKITLHEGMILDGRNRYRAMLAAGHTPGEGHFHEYESLRPSDTPLDYVIRANLHRRHLTPEKKCEIIAKLIAAQPAKSDRAIAKQAKADHHKVAKVRRKQESTGEVAPVEKRVGADGKPRKLPAKRKRPPTEEAKKAAVAPAAPPATVPHDTAPDEELELLREFARWFVTERVLVKDIDPKDRNEWRTLFGRVKATLGVAP